MKCNILFNFTSISDMWMTSTIIFVERGSISHYIKFKKYYKKLASPLVEVVIDL